MLTACVVVILMSGPAGHTMGDATVSEWPFGDDPVVHVLWQSLTPPPACATSADLLEWFRHYLPWPDFSADPNRRIRELLRQSEELRRQQDEWERFWHIDGAGKSVPGGEGRYRVQLDQNSGRIYILLPTQPIG